VESHSNSLAMLPRASAAVMDSPAAGVVTLVAAGAAKRKSAVAGVVAGGVAAAEWVGDSFETLAVHTNPAQTLGGEEGKEQPTTSCGAGAASFRS
jgi:hypothetical protein